MRDLAMVLEEIEEVQDSIDSYYEEIAGIQEEIDEYEAELEEVKIEIEDSENLTDDECEEFYGRINNIKGTLLDLVSDMEYSYRHLAQQQRDLDELLEEQEEIEEFLEN